jgi:hypothetical protein
MVEHDEDDWLNVDASADLAKPMAIVGMLNAVEQSLEEGPEDARYSVNIEIEQVR